MIEKVEESLSRLETYCASENYMGYDPYDGLNSSLFRAIPLLNRQPIARLAWIQLFKRLPVNLRPVTGVRKDYNPKALGLFLSGYCSLYSLRKDPKYLSRIDFFADKIVSLASKGWSGACWGYNFDWQAKAFFQPKFTPTVVATTFIGSSLLDAYEITGEKDLLNHVRSSCDFILQDLNRNYDEKGNFAFSYSPLDNSIVYNASLLGSRLLSRVYHFTKEDLLRDSARRAVTFCCDRQNKNGSWSYGTLTHHQWIDNFHTGYNLECISDYTRFTGDHTFDDNLERGLSFYINTFFTNEGISRYYSNSLYPIDIHAPAQLIITLSKLGKFFPYKALADKVLNWTIENMQSPEGYFYFQRNKWYTVKISYMRWAQSWMFYALSEYMLQSRKSNGATPEILSEI